MAADEITNQMTTNAGSKLIIFTVLFHRHSPQAFDRRWEEKARSSVSPSAPSDVKERLLHLYSAFDPGIHRYNDIAGFAEVYWDGGMRILADYYFLGDRRTRYGRRLFTDWHTGLSAKKYFQLAEKAQKGSFLPNDSIARKRSALISALQDVATWAKDLGCFVDLTAEIRIANCLDFAKLMSRD